MDYELEQRLNDTDNIIQDIMTQLQVCIKEQSDKYNLNDKEQEDLGGVDLIDNMDQQKIEEEQEQRFFNALQQLYAKIELSQQSFNDNIDRLKEYDLSVPENKEFDNFIYNVDNMYLQDKIKKFKQQVHSRDQQNQLNNLHSNIHPDSIIQSRQQSNVIGDIQPMMQEHQQQQQQQQGNYHQMYGHQQSSPRSGQQYLQQHNQQQQQQQQQPQQHNNSNNYRQF